MTPKRVVIEFRHARGWQIVATCGLSVGCRFLSRCRSPEMWRLRDNVCGTVWRGWADVESAV